MRYDLLSSERLWVIDAKINRNVKTLEVGLVLFYSGLPTFLNLYDSDENIPICSIEIPQSFLDISSSGNISDFTFQIIDLYE